MAPASKEGVTVADKEYLLGNKARELLKYTNQATKTVAEDATLIVKGKKTLDQVPALIRKQVEEILKDLEVEVE